MTMKTYNVALNEGVDYDEFWYEIENDGSGSTHVPYRAVDIINERSPSLRQCWYELNDTEAEKLRNDPRVFCVEIPPEFRTDIVLKTCSTQSNVYWWKQVPSTPIGPFAVNWGLIRMNASTNVTNGLEGHADYNYTLDGSGVDVVIMDTGCQIDHPEFTDANGVSRVQQIDWFSASGVAGTMPPFSAFYSDNEGHGTHVSGIAAGKTYGRAKNSRIFIMTLGSIAVYPSIGISPTDAFDCIKGWHNNKPVDPELGYKRPTVVNMSWGTFAKFALITGGNYRGTEWTGTTKQAQYGMIGGNDNLFGIKVDSIDIDVTELLSSGVILVGAPGNQSQTNDVVGGQDYNNFFTSSEYTTNSYYMRGPTPASSEGVICVGNVNRNGNPEYKHPYSDSGPRIDVWAPGTYIISSMSNANSYDGPYWGNTTARYPYDSRYIIANLEGTSMASPNVAGLAAQLLQLFPTATPAQIRQKIIDYSVPNMMYSTGLTTDYANNTSLHGAPNRYAYQPFNGAINGTVTGLSTLPTSIISAPH